jgi:hypothetical protein
MPRVSPWRSEHDWGWWGRPNQQAPRGDWRTWLLLAGRGFGKTRSGAECIREQVIHHRPPQPAPPRKPPAAAASTRRLIGVSNFRLAQIEECARLRRIDVVQYAWNMLVRRLALLRASDAREPPARRRDRSDPRSARPADPSVPGRRTRSAISQSNRLTRPRNAVGAAREAISSPTAPQSSRGRRWPKQCELDNRILGFNRSLQSIYHIFYLYLADTL